MSWHPGSEGTGSHKVSHHPSGDPAPTPLEHQGTCCFAPQDEQGLEFTCSVIGLFPPGWSDVCSVVMTEQETRWRRMGGRTPKWDSDGYRHGVGGLG